jgi:pimeloyl-ACP methyl ester carboxylesterase
MWRAPFTSEGSGARLVRVSSTHAPLSFAVVAASGASPDRGALFLHGVLGSGGNFRTVAKRVTEACPPWGAALVDLRAHGHSLAAPPPDSIAAAAADLVALEPHLPFPVRAVVGHSLGGKVALAYVRERARLGAPLDRAVVLDASPSASPGAEASGATAQILAMLEAMPQPYASRERFIEDVERAGHPRAIADWLAMNVRRADDGPRFRLDLGRVRALLADYFAVDLWDALEDPRAARAITVVAGGSSPSLDAACRERLEALAAASPRVTFRVLASAGHWVHADDPDGTVAVLTEALRGPS